MVAMEENCVWLWSVYFFLTDIRFLHYILLQTKFFGGLYRIHPVHQVYLSKCLKPRLTDTQIQLYTVYDLRMCIKEDIPMWNISTFNILNFLSIVLFSTHAIKMTLPLNCIILVKSYCKPNGTSTPIYSLYNCSCLKMDSHCSSFGNTLVSCSFCFA